MFITGEVFLKFEKDSEECEIVLTEGGLFTATVIRVKLYTVGRVRSQDRGTKKR